MFFGFLTLLAALMLSLTSAYFSVFGLAAMFAAAKVAIIVMGGSLEFAKIVTAAWAHRYWASGNFSKFMRVYMLSALVVLMCITSMGIFGFLSAGHLETAAATNGIQSKIDYITQQIQSEQTTIDRSSKQLNLLDKSLDVYFNNDKASAGLKARKSQEEERKELNQTVSIAQSKIDVFHSDLVPLQTTLSEQTEKIGPIKYVAELIFSDYKSNIDSAVRIIILMIIFAFDPLAILLILASSISFKEHNDAKKILKNEKIPDTIHDDIKDEPGFTVKTEQPEVAEETQVGPFIPNETFNTNKVAETIKTVFSKKRPWGYGDAKSTH